MPVDRVERDAPAKVNLFLRVLAREESGYHQIETLFQAIELADRIRLDIAPSDAGITLDVTGVEPGALGPADRNLAVRAARLLLDRVSGEGGDGAPIGVRIHLDKRIPHGAGLGGGSSDAAAVLDGVNELLGHPLTRGELVELGGTLGADVPFFLSGASLALGWGRGDRLLPLPALPPAELLIVVPPDPVSTVDAYRTLARVRGAGGRGAAPSAIVVDDATTASRTAAPPWQSWDAVSRVAENAFEEALAPERPEFARIRAALIRAGAKLALLSGSGSALFGVFPDGILSGVGVDASSEGRMSALAGEELPSGTRFIRTRTRG